MALGVDVGIVKAKEQHSIAGLLTDCNRWLNTNAWRRVFQSSMLNPNTLLGDVLVVELSTKGEDAFVAINITLTMLPPLTLPPLTLLNWWFGGVVASSTALMWGLMIACMRSPTSHRL